MLTLSEIKTQLIALAAATNCETVILKDSYVDLGVTYSILLKKTEGTTFTVAPDGTETSITIS